MADHAGGIGGDFELDHELVACTPKVPSLTTDTTFAQPYPPWSGGHFHNQAQAVSPPRKAEANGTKLGSPRDRLPCSYGLVRSEIYVIYAPRVGMHAAVAPAGAVPPDRGIPKLLLPFETPT